MIADPWFYAAAIPAILLVGIAKGGFGSGAGLFATPLMQQLPLEVQQSLAASIPFPRRLGKPEEFAELAVHVVTNGHLNGEVIRLDGALRMAPR